MRTIATSESLDALQLFWARYLQANPGVEPVYTIWKLGDTAALADELAATVLDRSKRGTVRLLRDFVARTEPLPKTGDHVVIVDANLSPRCIVRIERVEVKPIGGVDERFVKKNGEGDGSVAWWLTANMRYFKRQGVREGFSVDDRSEAVFIDFVLVWPTDNVRLDP